MGWWGSARTDDKAVAAKDAAPHGIVASGDLLNSKDLKYALDLAMNLGKTPEERAEDGTFRVFNLPFYFKKVFWDDWLANSKNEQFRAFAKSEGFRQTSSLIVKSLDMDGDGKLTPKDFQLMYDKGLSKFFSENQSHMDRYLPFAGQLAFGFAVGLGLGALARNLYKSKWWIAGTGFCAYSAAQYMMQQNFVDREILEQTFKAKVKRLADINGDGEINREDINELVANRMQFVATKLGPGGLAPGLTGYASLAVGFLRGVRMI